MVDLLQSRRGLSLVRVDRRTVWGPLGVYNTSGVWNPSAATITTQQVAAVTVATVPIAAPRAGPATPFQEMNLDDFLVLKGRELCAENDSDTPHVVPS